MDEFLSNIQQYRDQFYRFILRNLWDESGADDVFSSAILAAWENRHKYIPGTNFRAWMFRILTNKCFVANRETKRMFEPLNDDLADSIIAPNEADYEALLSDHNSFLEQCGDEVYRAFRCLSTAQRSCILLKDVEQFSYQEIADILEIPATTVMTHLARGRALLRSKLFEYAKKNGIIHTPPRFNARRRNHDIVLYEKVAAE